MADETISATAYPRYLMLVGGERVFATREEAQNLRFNRDDAKIEGHVQMDDGYYIVNLGPDGAEEDLFKTAGHDAEQ